MVKPSKSVQTDRLMQRWMALVDVNAVVSGRRGVRPKCSDSSRMRPTWPPSELTKRRTGRKEKRRSSEGERRRRSDRVPSQRRGDDR